MCASVASLNFVSSLVLFCLSLSRIGDYLPVSYAQRPYISCAASCTYMCGGLPGKSGAEPLDKAGASMMKKSESRRSTATASGGDGERGLTGLL
ncbi:hypothetical protein DFH11DRAFT_1587589 [Phellopilus nigrolimitatus]|nr:hypothetical protein DFH11DRAFT_1587589 [Phellopilus nigrolimitatus]